MQSENIFSILAILLIFYLFVWDKLKRWYNEGYYEKDKLKKYQESKINTNTEKISTVNNLVNESNSNNNSINQNELNKIKGNAFEKYIVQLFDVQSGRFKLQHWSSDKIADNGMYAEANKNPDLQFIFNGDNKTYRFAIECKWRNDFYNGGVEWAKQYQIQNYKNFEVENNTKVFVAIGVGGTAENPQRLFLAPLQEIQIYPYVFETYLKNFERNPNHKFFYVQHEQRLC